RGQVDLVGEAVPLLRVEVDELDRPGHARYQDQPRVVGIVHQPQFAQAEGSHRMGVLGQLRIQVPGFHGAAYCRCSAKKARVRRSASAALSAWKCFGSTSRLKACPAPSYTYSCACGCALRCASMSAGGVLGSSAPKWNSMGARS